MKKLYSIFLVVITLVSLALVVYLAREPKPTPLIETSELGSAEEAGETLAEALREPLQGTKVLILGITEPYQTNLEIWHSALVSIGAAQNTDVHLLVPDFLMSEFVQDSVWNEDFSMTIVEAVDFIDAVREARSNNKQVIVFLTAEMTSRLSQKSQVSELEAELEEPVLSASIVPLALTREAIGAIPPCQKELTPEVIRTDIACALQYKSRFMLNRNLDLSQYVGTLEAYGENEYLFFVHSPKKN